MTILIVLSLLGLLFVDGFACLRALRTRQVQDLAHALSHAAVVAVLGFAGHLQTVPGLLVILALTLATALAVGASRADQRRANRAGIAVRELADNAGTVLAAIRAASDVLMNESLAASSRKGIVRRIRSLSTRLSDSLLDQMDQEFGASAVETGPVSLFDICADTLSRFGSVARGGRRDLCCVVEEDLPRLVETDSRALRGCMSQLVESALRTEASTLEILLGRRGDQLGVGVTVPDSTEFRASEPELANLTRRVEPLGGSVASVTGDGRHGLELRLPLFPVPESEALLIKGRFRSSELAQTPTDSAEEAVLTRRHVLVFAPRSALGHQLEQILGEAGAEVDRVREMSGVRELVATDPRGHEAVILAGLGAAEEFEGAVAELHQLGIRAPLVAVGHAEELAAATGVDGVLAPEELENRLVPDLLQRFCAALAPGLGGESTRVAPIESKFADDPRFRPLVERFVEAVPGFLREMREARDRNSSDQLRRLAHRLKGTGTQYGYEVATEAGARLERVILDNAPNERIEAATAQLYAVLQGILLGAARTTAARGGV